MKIVITAVGEDLQSQVDPRFGRGAYFILVDVETLDFVPMSNKDGQGTTQGAGVQAAQWVAESGATALLTGHCGPKAHQLLSAANVKVYNNVDGTVLDAVNKFRAGELVSSDTADVDGHWK